ncbi:sensor histidine kinase [Crocinitomix algicola]|uniref:sensor histidine kinase n=1 Tax=Crocinitomix algicola TaxID=1740263 RepID=UPI000835273F|nr:sensor histidine kinase [Crocinitomix algicola]
MSKRFKDVLPPAILLAGGMNVVFIFLYLYLNETVAIWNPIVSAFLFCLIYFFLKKERLKPIIGFIVGATIVVYEIYFHTYLFGWDVGYYIFLFIIPVIFLFNSNWTKKQVVIFIGLFIMVVSGLIYFFWAELPVYPMGEEEKNIVKIFNQYTAGSAVFILLIYFSRTIVKKDAELQITNERLLQQNELISNQNNQAQVLLKEVHHRVKNNLQIISSLISLQKNKIENGEVKNVLIQAKRRVESMARVHEKLYVDDEKIIVDFKSYLEDIVQTQQILSEDVNITLKADQVRMQLDTAVPFGLVVSELITNSIKHAYKNIEHKKLSISFQHQPNDYLLKVIDNGVGLPENFSFKNEHSLGAEIIYDLVDQLAGEINYKNENGAHFIIRVAK